MVMAVCDFDNVNSLQSTLLDAIPGFQIPTKSSDDYSSECSDAASADIRGEVSFDAKGFSHTTQELEYIVDSLFRLSPALEKTVEKVSHRELRVATLQESPLDLGIYMGVLSDRYPDAPSDLIRLVSRDALDCYRRLGFANRHEQSAKPALATTLAPLVMADLRQGSTSRGIQEGTFHDSGLGTSFSPQPGVVDCAMARDAQQPIAQSDTSVSVYSDPVTLSCEMDRFALPSMPQHGPEGFICPICHSSQGIMNPRQWK
jgi:hypothetical protein